MMWTGARRVRAAVQRRLPRIRVASLAAWALLCGIVPVVSRADGATLEWTDEERAYLQRKGPIRMCAAPEWMPMEGIDGNGRHTGMAADFIQLMARRGGLEIQLVPARTWQEAYAMGQRRQCDIFSMLMDSPSRREYLNFTSPYLEIPGVIATSTKVPFVASLEQVVDKRLGHMRGFAGIELLRLRYPEIQLVGVGSYEEGLERVQNGELFGFIGNMVSVGYALQNMKMTDVKIAGRIGSDNLMSIAARNDEPLLLQMLQKLVDSIQPKERQEIMNRWMAVRFEQGFDYRLFWRALAIFLLVAVVGLWWTMKLRRLNARLRSANERLAEISRRDALTGLYNRMHFDETVGPTLRLCSRNGLTMSLAIIDLDRFKEINDTFGHSFGDACLRHVAAALEECFRRESDTAIRYGGEEFILMSAGGTTAEMIRQMEAFRRTIEQSSVTIDGRRATLTVSVGMWSAVPDTDEDPIQVLNLADLALYQAKGAGRNRLMMANTPPIDLVAEGAG